MKKEILLGTYKYEEQPDGSRHISSCYGGTNSWDIKIKEAGLVGKELKLKLVEEK